MEILYLCLSAFLAGFIDSIVGGGGLIQLPALLIFLPQQALPIIFGTNKFASSAGTAVALWRYSLNIKINWRTVLPCAIAASVFSFVGARSISLINPALMKPAILILLILVAGFTFKRKDFGSLHAPKLSADRERLVAIVFGAAIGFYDGFFGPGTGSFLIFGCIALLGFSFLAASATAKMVNLATNVGALLFFVIAQQVYYEAAIPMALANVAGSAIGSRLAIKKGSGFVRLLFLFVVSALILRLGYDLIKL